MTDRHHASSLSLSAAGLDLIARSEGFVATVYDDAAGHATIGYGHLLHLGPATAEDRAKWGTITDARAREILRDDAKQAQASVRRLVNVPLAQGEFDALVDFAFNLGGGNLESSTLLRLLNAGDRDGAAGQFAKWNKAGGKVLRGLVERRLAEERMFRGLDW